MGLQRTAPVVFAVLVATLLLAFANAETHVTGPAWAKRSDLGKARVFRRQAAPPNATAFAACIRIFRDYPDITPPSSFPGVPTDVVAAYQANDCNTVAGFVGFVGRAYTSTRPTPGQFIRCPLNDDRQCGGALCITCRSLGIWLCDNNGQYNVCEQFAGVVPPPPPRQICGTSSQCGANKCWQCPSRGWACGATAADACCPPGVFPCPNQDLSAPEAPGPAPAPAPPAPTPPPPPGKANGAICGVGAECSSGRCFQCNSGGWKCGATSATCCPSGITPCPGVDLASPPAPGSRPPRTECGLSSQCGNVPCWRCPAFGWNCGASAFEACQDASATVA